jgi:small subunit ribosomal protein S20
MATHKSAEKRARQSVKRAKINHARRAQVHTLTRALDEAISKKDAAAAAKALRAVEAALARNAGRGTLHWKTAARKTSRLAKRVKALKGRK